ncbi:hypothetical protein BJ742DRAFT_286500 [Cladochytrium replicatum]|nr:hypothetical protein BJ742DRAFT_286500 [Cladochytrium replicatum]
MDDEKDFADLLGEDWRPDDGDSGENYAELLDYDVLGDYGTEEQARGDDLSYHLPVEETESALVETKKGSVSEDPESLGTKESDIASATAQRVQHPTPPRPRPYQLPMQLRMNNNTWPIHGYPRPFGYQQRPPYQHARPASIRQYGVYSGEGMGQGAAGMRPNDGRPYIQQRGPQNYQAGWTGVEQNYDSSNKLSRFPNPMQIPGNSMNSGIQQMGREVMPQGSQPNWSNSVGYVQRPLRPPGPSIHVNPRFNRGMLPFHVQENIQSGPNTAPVFSRYHDRQRYPPQPSMPNYRLQDYPNQFGVPPMNFPAQSMMSSFQGRNVPPQLDVQRNFQTAPGSTSGTQTTLNNTHHASSSQPPIGPRSSVEESNVRKRREVAESNEMETVKRLKVDANTIAQSDSPTNQIRPAWSTSIGKFPLNPQKGTVVSISNLAENVDLSAIEELGRQIGPILGVKMLPEGNVVELAFESPELAKLCRRKLHKTHYHGALIQVNVEN